MNILTKKNNWLVIVNLHAGSGRCKSDWHEIKKLLDTSSLKTTISFTDEPNSAIKITHNAIENDGIKNIIIVGGDGTMNEVVNGIFKQKRYKTDEINLGLITVGTGNDWGRHYGLPTDYAEMIKIIETGKKFTQDVGSVSYSNTEKKQIRYFVNIAGMGFDALVAKKTNVSKKNGHGGLLVYLINLIHGLFQYVSTHISIAASGNEVCNEEVFSMSIGICKYNGGGMMQLPKAISDDGLLDVTVIKKTSKFTVIKNIKNLYDGSFIKMKEVETFTGSDFEINANPPESLYLETDGESLGHSPLFFKIVPKAITLFVGKNFINT